MRQDHFLLFVTDEDSSVLTELTNSLDKTTSARKPRCTLSALIFSPVGMKKEWKRFTGNLGIPVRFLHSDEAGKELKDIHAAFPAVFLQTGDIVRVIIHAEDINRCATLEDLMSLVTLALQQYRV
jgi:hypothetical protein